MKQRRSRSLAIVPMLFLVLAFASCDDDDGPLSITVSATILEPGVAASVEASDIRDADDETIAHDVRLTWNGDEPASFDDARFTHDVEGSDSGHLVIAGRGCGVDWDASEADVMHVCTADFHLVWLQPGETHDYPVAIFPEVGPLELERGLYVIDEVVAWSHSDEPAPPRANGGEFTIRLTYTVE